MASDILNSKDVGYDNVGGLRFGRPVEAPGRQTSEFRDTYLKIMKSWAKL